MVLDLVFSFLLNSWKGLPDVDWWAKEHLGGVESLLINLKREEQILCTLERQRLLAYDGKWKKYKTLNIPVECRPVEKKAEPMGPIEFRSQTLPSASVQAAWDHRIEVKIHNQTPFTLYLRQDKKYVGAHSTTGWAMWIERKTGDLRYEWIDLSRDSHFRMKAQGALNPVQGRVTKLHNLTVLFVSRLGGKLQKAFAIHGTSKDGFRHVAYKRKEDRWVKSHDRCTRPKGCKKGLPLSLEEDRLAIFADVSSHKYASFLERGLPLAFTEVRSEELVPVMADFR